jgi:DNA-binding NarL/FixJ family response regulator
MADHNPKVLTKEFLAERDLRMFKQRQAGISTTEIAKRFGTSISVVNKAIQRQLEKLNREAIMAYPEVLRMELERLDSLQSAIWPLTQHRKVSMPDGTEVMVEPDLKAIQQVLAIMDKRSKLLGMDQNNVHVQMDVHSKQEIKASLAGAVEAVALDSFNPEAEARSLLEIMGRSGVLPADVVNEILNGGNKSFADDAIAIGELVSGEEADDHE